MRGRLGSAPLRDELRALLAEFLGTAFLLAAIVGSGIVTQTDGPASTQLFQHAIAVGAALVALILTFGAVSGAHLNPVVTLADAWFGGMPWRRVPGYVVAQLFGGVVGVVVTATSFGLAPLTIGTQERIDVGVAIGEGVATFGLLLVIFGVVRSGGGRAVAGAVGAYIAAAIFFTSSAAFANPVVTLARSLSDTYTAIAPSSIPGFLAGQTVGLVLAVMVIAFLFDPSPQEAAEVVVPTGDVASPAPTRKVLRMSDRPTVLFLCVHNAGRSQMAAGFLRHLAGDAVDVRSGGSAPADTVNPAAVAAMAEVGIDIRGEQPRPWTAETVGVADVIVSMGCGDACPVLPGTRSLDWELDDPAGQGVAAVRPIRDDIERRVRALLAELVPAAG